MKKMPNLPPGKIEPERAGQTRCPSSHTQWQQSKKVLQKQLVVAFSRSYPLGFSAKLPIMYHIFAQMSALYGLYSGFFRSGAAIRSSLCDNFPLVHAHFTAETIFPSLFGCNRNDFWLIQANLFSNIKIRENHCLSTATRVTPREV